VLPKERTKTILVVDDMTLNLRTAKLMLEEFFIVHLAKSGQIAMNVLAEIEIDLILLDIEMPGMSGFDFMELLKKSNSRYVPVIFVTSHTSADLISRALKAGARDYVAKPYEKNILLKKIYNVFSDINFYITEEGRCVALPAKDESKQDEISQDESKQDEQISG
jgi:CheY-like chemotaxis protein